MNDVSKCVLTIWGRRKQERIQQGTRIYWDAEYYTYTKATEDSSVRDEQHARDVMKTLVGKSSSWKNEEPVAQEGFSPWFTIVISISNTRRRTSHYSVDYMSHASSPLGVRGVGMEIYRTIKRNIKRSVANGKAK